MDERAAAADVGAQFCGASDHVSKQSGAEASSLVGEIYAEPSQQGDWLSVAASTLAVGAAEHLPSMMLAMHQA